ncbi:MAG: triose-phosphate isomerase [Nitrososphaerota archaeon]|nr:triose-phosphate isomerase [Nitrososphaerota archaeon]
MRTLIVNCKNYPEVLGEGAVKLARAVAGVSGTRGVRAIVAPPTPLLSLVAAKTHAVVYSQGVGTMSGERTTGAVLPGAVKAAGAVGTILNHSESKLSFNALADLLPRLEGLEACLCASTSAEASKLSRLRPAYVAVEPPELIGTGVAVSKARPGLIRDTVVAVRRTGYTGGVLCGAGIVTGEDVKKAVELGADGVLVASSVVKAKDWDDKVGELAHSLM